MLLFNSEVRKMQYVTETCLDKTKLRGIQKAR